MARVAAASRAASAGSRGQGGQGGQGTSALLEGGQCTERLQATNHTRHRLATAQHDQPVSAAWALGNMLRQHGAPKAPALLRKGGGLPPARQRLSVAVVLAGQLRSLPAAGMRQAFGRVFERLRAHVALFVVASVELASGPPTKAANKLRLAGAGGAQPRMRWVGSQYSVTEVRRMLQEWRVPHRLRVLPATGAELARNVSRLMQRYGGAGAVPNAAALVRFDPHESNAELGAQWWKLALAYELLLSAERELAPGGRAHFVLKVRPDVCPQGLLGFDAHAVAMLRGDPHVARLNADLVAILPRYAAEYYFRWAMLQCINGRFRGGGGARADDLQTSMAASGVPILHSTKQSGLLAGYIVRTVTTQPGLQQDVAPVPVPVASVRGFELGEVSTCAWLPVAAWSKGSPQSQGGCTAARCQ